jgi:nuclear pore complex protein Nup98-Nup96
LYEQFAQLLARHFFLMARFRAYISDSSDDDDEEQVLERPKGLQKVSANLEYSEEEDSDDESSSSPSSSSSSEMDEDELEMAPNALVEDDDGEYRYGHEVGKAKSSTASNRDPTIIPRAHTVGIDAQRMHVMQTSLFRMPEEAAALKAMKQPSRTSLRVNDQPLTRKHSRDSDGDGLRFESKEVCISCISVR